MGLVNLVVLDILSRFSSNLGSYDAPRICRESDATSKSSLTEYWGQADHPCARVKIAHAACPHLR
jgi:hypothetical protein